MRRIGSIIIIAGILLLTGMAGGEIVHADQPRGQWRWRTVNSPTSEHIKFVYGKSPTDFWMSSKSGALYHYQDSVWTTLIPPRQKGIMKHRYFMPDGQSIWLVLIDREFHSHIFRHARGTWQRISPSISVPINGVVALTTERTWFYGDWGAVYELIDDSLRYIESPIRHHIFTINAPAPDDVWIGTRSQGIFHYRGREFHPVPMDDPGDEDVYHISVSPDGIQAQCMSGRLYTLRDSVFVPVYQHLPWDRYLFYQVSDSTPGLTINREGQAFIRLRDQWTPFSLPVTQFLTGGKLFSSREGVLTGDKGLVLISTASSDLFFTDIAELSYIDGSPHDRSHAAAWLDIDHNDSWDLLVLNSQIDHYNRFYLNTGRHRFLDITGETPLSSDLSTELLAIGDMNNDGTEDIIRTTFTENRLNIHIIQRSWRQWHHRSSTVDLDSLRLPSHILPMDIDRDGDLDLVGSLRYGPERHRSELIVLKNRWSGRLSLASPSSSPIIRSPGWNRFLLAADLNNDHWTDLIVCNDWQPNRILINHRGRFVGETESRFFQHDTTNTHRAAAMDYDNDGDLDLFFVSQEKVLSVYRNDSAGLFTDVSDSLGLPVDRPPTLTTPHINFGDFNHDGFVDIFITGLERTTERNWLYLNDGGRRFYDGTSGTEVRTPMVEGSIIADVDQDGDLDIYGYRNGSNSLWMNNQNDQNYLIITPAAIRSNRSALGTKIWVYDAGYLEHPAHLRGFRQIGTWDSQPNMINARSAHFGVDARSAYDVKVRFPRGKVRVLKNIAAGQSLQIAEYSSLAKSLILFPNALIRILTTRALLYYTLVTLLSIALILGAVTLGRRRYRWSIPTSSVVLILNLSAYWILVFLSHSESSNVRYILPLLPVLFGTVIPLAWSDRFTTVRNLLRQRQTQPKDLLTHVLVFSHGEWAMRNINSLLLLNENTIDLARLSESLLRQLNERTTTFLNSTLPALKTMRDRCRPVLSENALTEELSNRIDLLETGLISLKNTGFADENIRNEWQPKIVESLQLLRGDLRKIKDRVYGQFSCDAQAVVIRVTNAAENELRRNGVRLARTKYAVDHPAVLIAESDLVPILDNAIRNAIRALQPQREKQLSMLIYRHPPKIHIDVKDTGTGIPKDQWETVFSRGFSGSGGTGLGLTHAREILKSYGGRIYIKHSQPQRGTVLTIELLEGKLQHEPASVNH